MLDLEWPHTYQNKLIQTHFFLSIDLFSLQIYCSDKWKQLVEKVIYYHLFKTRSLNTLEDNRKEHIICPINVLTKTWHNKKERTVWSHHNQCWSNRDCGFSDQLAGRHTARSLLYLKWENHQFYEYSVLELSNFCGNSEVKMLKSQDKKTSALMTIGQNNFMQAV